MSDPRKLFDDPLALAQHFIAILDPRLDYLANNGDVILVLSREIARLTAEGKELREQLDARVKVHAEDRECLLPVLARLRAETREEALAKIALIYEERDEARRRLGLAEAWLKADEENVLITIEHGKVTAAREAFRDSLKGPV